MPNEYVNKVVQGNETLIDISDTTATSEDVVDGVVFYAQNGERMTGSAQIPPMMSLLSYGTSTWADFLAAYTTNSIVYCRASSNSNPATGSKTRMAFMAYVNNETNPTNVEFQYYRSVSSHSATQQGDQVYVYKLDKTSGWSVTVRESYSKVIAGTGLSSSYANSAITLNSTVNGVPVVSASDNDKVLKVVNGAWAAASEGGGVSMTTTTCMLGTTGWTNNTTTQEATGVTASNNVVVSPSPSSAADYAAAGIVCTAQGAGTLTFKRTSANTNAITVNVLILS